MYRAGLFNPELKTIHIFDLRIYLIFSMSTTIHATSVTFIQPRIKDLRNIHRSNRSIRLHLVIYSWYACCIRPTTNQELTKYSSFEYIYSTISILRINLINLHQLYKHQSHSTQLTLTDRLTFY